MSMKKSLLLLSLVFSVWFSTIAQTMYYTAPNGDKWGFEKISYNSKAKLVSFQPGGLFTGNLNIPNTVTDDANPAVTLIVDQLGSSMCEGNTSITSITFSTNLTRIGKWVFKNCTNLTGPLNFPPNIELIGEETFIGCMKITDVVWTKSDQPSAQIISWGPGGNFGAFSHSGIRSFTLKTTTGNPYRGGGDLQGTFKNCPNLEVIDFSIVAPTSSLMFTIEIHNASHVLFYSSPGIFHNYIKPTVNFIENGVCQHFSVQDAHNMHIPHNFIAQKVTYDNTDENTRRSFSGKNCKTLCLPYPAVLPNGMRAYKLTKKNTEGASSFMFLSVGDGGTQLEANTPYLVRIIDDATSKEFPIQTGSIQISSTPTLMEVTASDDGNSFFGGTIRAIDNATAAAQGMYNLSNDKWYPITTATPTGSVHPFRAYIRTTGGLGPAKAFAIILEDNETTAIDKLEQDVEQNKGNIFTLDGRMVGTDINTLKSGEIYIRNGKKFYKF